MSYLSIIPPAERRNFDHNRHSSEAQKHISLFFEHNPTDPGRQSAIHVAVWQDMN